MKKYGIKVTKVLSLIIKIMCGTFLVYYAYIGLNAVRNQNMNYSKNIILIIFGGMLIMYIISNSFIYGYKVFKNLYYNRKYCSKETSGEKN